MNYPTIHIGGTARETLERDYLTALDAVRDAIVALKITAPHGWDYMMPGTDITDAQSEHTMRLSYLAAVEAELELLLDHIMNWE